MSVTKSDLVARSAGELDAALTDARHDNLRVGFVPTLGALHEGHAADVRQARAQCDVVVVSIFLNPLQFDDANDLARYGRDLAADVRTATRAGADVVFAPSVEEMYPVGEPEVVVDPGPKGEILEGVFRPKHFQGVATVVTKLLVIVRPTVAYFGEKDYQQLVIVRQVVRDLSLRVEIIACPTMREADGLAISSRNAFLDSDARMVAASLFRALTAAKETIGRGERDPNMVVEVMERVVGTSGRADLDYVHVVREGTLDDVSEIEGDVRLLIAAHVGAVRLIDNLLVEKEASER